MATDTAAPRVGHTTAALKARGYDQHPEFARGDVDDLLARAAYALSLLVVTIPGGPKVCRACAGRAKVRLTEDDVQPWRVPTGAWHEAVGTLAGLEALPRLRPHAGLRDV